ncbi:MAG TPA: hypothetical protein VKI44_34020 [Acetobacteraceae bacterium]|nr:hypothetical protein [Acetobacteraceae bacterium]
MSAVAVCRLARLFTRPTWWNALLLVTGAILAPGKRTVTAALRILGREQDTDFPIYHGVLNRAVWSSRAVAGWLLRLLVGSFLGPDATVVIGIAPKVTSPYGGARHARPTSGRRPRRLCRSPCDGRCRCCIWCSAPSRGPNSAEIACTHLGIRFESAAGQHHRAGTQIVLPELVQHPHAIDARVATQQRGGGGVVQHRNADTLESFVQRCDEVLFAAQDVARQPAPELEFSPTLNACRPSAS